MSEDLSGQLRALRHRERYVTELLGKVKAALGDEKMKDDEVVSAVEKVVGAVTTTKEIGGLLKKLAKPLWPLLNMRDSATVAELEAKYPDWESEV